MTASTSPRGEPESYADYKLIESRKPNKVEVENAAQDFLRDYPGVEAVYTRTQMEQGMPNTACEAGHPGLAPEDQWRHRIMNKPNWYLFAKPNTYASTHGRHGPMTPTFHWPAGPN